MKEDHVRFKIPVLPMTQGESQLLAIDPPPRPGWQRHVCAMLVSNGADGFLATGRVSMLDVAL